MASGNLFDDAITADGPPRKRAFYRGTVNIIAPSMKCEDCDVVPHTGAETCAKGRVCRSRFFIGSNRNRIFTIVVVSTTRPVALYVYP